MSFSVGFVWEGWTVSVALFVDGKRCRLPTFLRVFTDSMIGRDQGVMILNEKSWGEEVIFSGFLGFGFGR